MFYIITLFPYLPWLLLVLSVMDQVMPAVVVTERGFQQNGHTNSLAHGLLRGRSAFAHALS